MNVDEALEVERKGADAGLNPMFGEWQHRFSLAPVPYGNGKGLAAFKAAIQAELGAVRFFYADEVKLEITLFLDMQTVLETSETADLDNYAKAILDGLRGPAGIIFDDTQVQALCISWIDSHETYFTVEAKASPDSFVLKGVESYEMPDGLWYPHGKTIWTNGDAEDTSELSFFAGLLINEMMSEVQRAARMAFRKSGYDRLEAYRTGGYFSSSARGFHKSRVTAAGFVLRPREEWRTLLEIWRAADPIHIAEIETMMKDIKERCQAVATAISGGATQ